LTVAENIDDNDDNDDNDDFVNDGDDNDDDIVNNDDDDIQNDMDGIDDSVNEGDNLNTVVNQLEEWDQVADNEGNTTHNCGNKRPHSSTVSAIKWCKSIKVHATTGARPKAGNYEVVVQKILHEAIPLYRGYLSTINPFPGAMVEMRWANKSWKGGCEECGTRTAPNDEIIKLVSAHAACHVSRSPFLKITSHGSHFRGYIKTKVQLLVRSMYGFSSYTKPKGVSHNIKLACELKKKFGFLYAVCFS